MRKAFLRSVLVQESRAYGFTLAFWGSGILLIDAFGIPTLYRVLFYTGGAILGFGILTLVAFRKALSTVEYEQPQYLVFSMVHFISALAPIVLTHFAIIGVQSQSFFDPWIAYLIAGLTVSMGYNLLMLIEERLSRKALKWEKKLVNI